MLTRETKAGLVVAGSFICLVVVVLIARLRDGASSPDQVVQNEPTQPAPAPAQVVQAEPTQPSTPPAPDEPQTQPRTTSPQVPNLFRGWEPTSDLVTQASSSTTEPPAVPPPAPPPEVPTTSPMPVSISTPPLIEPPALVGTPPSTTPTSPLIEPPDAPLMQRVSPEPTKPVPPKPEPMNPERPMPMPESPMPANVEPPARPTDEQRPTPRPTEPPLPIPAPPADLMPRETEPNPDRLQTPNQPPKPAPETWIERPTSTLEQPRKPVKERGTPPTSPMRENPVKPPVTPANTVRGLPEGFKPTVVPEVDSWDEDIHVWRAGDTFQAVSRKFYEGNEVYWQALLEFNRAHPMGADGLRANPPVMRPGQNVFAPPTWVLEKQHAAALPRTLATPVASTTAVPGERSYRVTGQGEMLLEIAKKTQARWEDIYLLNRQYDPKQPIPAGTTLRLPANAQAPVANRR